MAYTQGRIFVFGTDAAGFHGSSSAARAVRNFGAQYGVTKGRTGDAYAIVLFTAKLVPLNINKISNAVTEFLQYARDHSELNFDMVEIGSGHFGFNDSVLRPLFKDAPDNIILPGDDVPPPISGDEIPPDIYWRISYQSA